MTNRNGLRARHKRHKARNRERNEWKRPIDAYNAIHRQGIEELDPWLYEPLTEEEIASTLLEGKEIVPW